MPNWCDNKLTISGKKAEEVERFLNFIKSDDSDFDFNNVIPYPEKWKNLDEVARRWDESHERGEPRLKKRPKDGFNLGGYDWCALNWGTKWNANSPYVSKMSDRKYIIQFYTPWGPPYLIVDSLMQKFPELTFSLKYHVPGMRNSGTMNKNGVRRKLGGKIKVWDIPTYIEFERRLFKTMIEIEDRQDERQKRKRRNLRKKKSMSNKKNGHIRRIDFCLEGPGDLVIH